MFFWMGQPNLQVLIESRLRAGRGGNKAAHDCAVSFVGPFALRRANANLLTTDVPLVLEGLELQRLGKSGPNPLAYLIHAWSILPTTSA